MKSTIDVFDCLTKESSPFLYKGKPLSFYASNKRPKDMVAVQEYLSGKKSKNRRRRKKAKKVKKLTLKERYTKYIKSKEWRSKCNAFYKKYGRQCQACGSFDEIVMHHMTYVNMGKERDEDLCPLCRQCHTEYHLKNGTQTNMVQKTLAFVNMKYSQDNDT